MLLHSAGSSSIANTCERNRSTYHSEIPITLMQRQPERQQVRFRSEHKVVHIQYQILVLGEQQEQILEGLSQHERVHLILVPSGGDVTNRREAARHLCVFLQVGHHGATDLEVVGVFGRLKQGNEVERIVIDRISIFSAWAHHDKLFNLS